MNGYVNAVHEAKRERYRLNREYVLAYMGHTGHLPARELVALVSITHGDAVAEAYAKKVASLAVA